MESLEVARLNLRPEEERVVDRVVARWVRRLQRQRHEMITMNVAVERPQGSVHDANPYRVRVRVTAPGNREVVVVKGGADQESHLRLLAVMNAAFRVVDRQLREVYAKVRDRRRRWVSLPPTVDGGLGFVLRIDREAGYGFLRGIDGAEVYFHRNAVLPDFDDVQVGTQVQFESDLGDEGLRATTVRVVDKPPHRRPTGAVADPEGWMRQDTDF